MKGVTQVLLILVAVCYYGGTVAQSTPGSTLAVTASVAGGGQLSSGLAHLAVYALRSEGRLAAAVPPPAECSAPHTADARRCREALLAQLARGMLHVALFTAPAARPPSATWPLRDAGLDELSDAAPPLRRLCVAPPPARSLLDLSEASVAEKYHITQDRLAALVSVNSTLRQNSSSSFVPRWCTAKRARCATILTGDEGEMRILERIILTHDLRASVQMLSPALDTLTPMRESSFVVCGWAVRRKGAAPLGPPPCDIETDEDECPFESRRLVKLVNARELARSSRAVRVLVRLRLNGTQLRELSGLTREWGPEDAVARYIAAHPVKPLPREVRVAVLLPDTTRRQAYDAAALVAAAALAEADFEKERFDHVKFKVETYDDHCDATRAYRYLNDALNTREYESLSAVVGPACGAAFADVARTAPGPVHSLPAIAYTPQAPPAPPAAALALLAAGDARAYASILGALFSHMGWRRLAALSEPGTRAALAAARLRADLVAHLELPDDKTDYDPDIFTQWATRVAQARGRVVWVCVEDGRAVRAALCAGYSAGLTPEAGAVWLLPAMLPADAFRPTPGDACSPRQLAEMIEGHLSVAPDWALPWLENVAITDQEKEHNGTDSKEAMQQQQWNSRWRENCALLGVKCKSAGPHAALLYDALRLWARALAGIAPATDLHDGALVRSLVTNSTKIEFSGVTGRFDWVAANEEGRGAAFARESPLLLLQWNGARRRRVGSWRSTLQLTQGALRWVGGRVPDDGAEPCALQGLADLLHADCRAAFLTLGAFLLAIAVLSAAGAAMYCRRRAERAYRTRLEELGLHALLPKTIGLDRWEIPRERVVINRKLGTGAFGTVYGGHALLAEERGWSAVAVKTLKAGASTEEKLDFLSEAEAMKRFDHKNVVRLLGVVTKTSPVCTVMEFMLYGDLKNYLLARRQLAGGADADEQVSARRLTAMALDAARGLSYLAQLRYVHRDVAARNCLVSARRVVKLADFGMTRLVFENDYYRFSRKGMLPVRWMAPESLTLGVFSPASDVWSFGVLLYEIVTFGSLPFQGRSNEEVLARVKAGGTLELPPGLKPQLEGLIKWCWKHEQKARPTASEVAAFLADWPRLLTPCLAGPLDALPLDALPDEPSWAAPASHATDTTYLSDADRFLP